MCSFQQDGTPNERSIGATEIGKLLRSLLGIPDQTRNDIRSHSLKSTVLSWLAKAGVPLAIRRLAGHHLDPSSKSAETYSRDAMSHVLVEIEKVVASIAAKKFLPDATRSGRYVQRNSSVKATLHARSSDDSDTESVVDNESEGSRTDASSDASDGEIPGISDSTPLLHFVVPELRPCRVNLASNMVPWRHSVSLLIHVAKDGGDRSLCGRHLNDNYQKLLSVSDESCRCKTCFLHKDATVNAP